MKFQNILKSWRTIAGVAALTFSAWCVAAENSASDSILSASPTSPKLSYGVADVLKLSGAKISDDTIVSYIRNSDNSFGGLSASEIVYLHEQGISDRVVTSMLEQRKRTGETAAQSASQQPTVPAPAPTAIIAGGAPQVYTSPVTYVDTTPSVIVMHDSSPRLVDYGIYPSYGYYGGYSRYGYGGYGGYGSYGYYCPPVSLSFGFRTGYRGSYSAGFHSAGFSGGGFHGGFHGGGHHR